MGYTIRPEGRPQSVPEWGGEWALPGAGIGGFLPPAPISNDTPIAEAISAACTAAEEFLVDGDWVDVADPQDVAILSVYGRGISVSWGILGDQLLRGPVADD